LIGRIRGTTIAGASARAGKHILRGKDDVLAFLDAITVTD